jgi:hypothetical protein
MRRLGGWSMLTGAPGWFRLYLPYFNHGEIFRREWGESGKRARGDSLGYTVMRGGDFIISTPAVYPHTCMDLI